MWTWFMYNKYFCKITKFSNGEIKGILFIPPWSAQTVVPRDLCYEAVHVHDFYAINKKFHTYPVSVMVIMHGPCFAN